MQAFLLDIEGTTTPVEFVFQVLFPYAREHVRQFLESHCGGSGVLKDIDHLRNEYSASARQNQNLPAWIDEPPQRRIESAVAYVHWLMDRDDKSTALKSLQGKIWEEGYRSGELRSQVYPDVPPAFARWRKLNIGIWIFSSGSVLAQKLLFANTTEGDLNPFIRGNFDTTTGPKKDAGSYQRIAASMTLPAPEVLFVSDVVAELDAAHLAGMETRLCVRPGRPQPDSSSHPIIHTFEEILP